jgi:acylphosphatase
MTDTVVRVRVRVRGRVQGVFFRDACRHEARVARVNGWVRNRRDGSVEAVFEGQRDGVERMARWCWQGPPHALVESVEITDEAPIGEMSFRVAGSA